MTVSNKSWIIGGALAILALLSAMVVAAGQVSAQPSSVVIQTQAANPSVLTYMSPGTATTTYQFDSPTFSSGKVANMQPIDSGAMMLEAIASSTTLSTIAWQFQFSNDGNVWYGENSAIAVSNLVGATPSQSLATTTITHFWTPGSTATSTAFFAIPTGPAQHERVTFFIPGTPSTTASSSAIYFELDLKKNPSTP